MALYIGSNQYRKIYLGSESVSLEFFSSIIPMFDGILLISSDNYVLKSADDMYLTTK